MTNGKETMLLLGGYGGWPCEETLLGGREVSDCHPRYDIGLIIIVKIVKILTNCLRFSATLPICLNIFCDF